jgi:transposase
MIGLSFPSSIFLSARACDLRKSIDGLCGEVRDYLGCNPMDGTLFVFYNRRRDKIKLLLWQADGYWVYAELGINPVIPSAILCRADTNHSQTHE